MKMHSGHVQFAGPQSVCCKGLQLALVLGVALFAAGCGRKESPKPEANTPSASPSPAQPTTPTAPPPVAPAPAPVDTAAGAKTDNDVPVLQQLNRAVMGFRMQYHRNPASVEELATTAGISLPPPPPGKKYAFNHRGLIDLVDISAK